MDAMMRAAVQDAYGPPDTLQVREVPKPSIGDDEVLVRVRAAGVDRGARHLMTGEPYVMRIMGFGLRAPKVRVAGTNVAGHVEALGKGVTGFRVGDEVYGTAKGSFAEHAAAAAAKLAPKPSGLTFEEAAVLPYAGLVALQALRDRGKVEPGQRLLIVGASGAVGTIAVQIANALGAAVTGVVGTDNVERVRSLGADHVIDYTREDFADGTHRYDLVLDIGGNTPVSRLRRALTPRGTLVIVGGEAGGRWLGIGRQIRASLLSPFVRQRLRTLIASEASDQLRALNELVDAGAVRPVVDRTYPLSEAREAMRDLEEGRTRGRIAITV